MDKDRNPPGDSFDALRTRLTPIVKRLAADAVWRDDQFEDAEAAAWEAAWKAIEAFDPAKGTKRTTWVFRRVRDRLKRWRNRSIRLASREKTTIDLDTLPAREVGVPAVEARDAIAWLWERLTPEQRVVFGRLQLGMSQAEIARSLCINRKTLNSRIRRWLAEVREMQ